MGLMKSFATCEAAEGVLAAQTHLTRVSCADLHGQLELVALCQTMYSRRL